jgi:hypothetical protein
MLGISPENVNKVVSDEGFSVELVGRGGIIYREPPREIRVDSETLALGGRFDVVIYANSIRNWGEPYGQVPIEPNERRQIVDNIRRALEFRGLRIDVEGEN